LDLPHPQLSTWLIPWPWWIVIGLAAGFFVLLLGWSWLVMAKQADNYIAKDRQRRSTDRANRNGIGRP
jgi:Tfp pilus assembly protein PilO